MIGIIILMKSYYFDAKSNNRHQVKFISIFSEPFIKHEFQPN